MIKQKARKKMPHSLRVRLSGLRYKKIISDKDYDRLCKALDNEKVLDEIRAEIERLTTYRVPRCGSELISKNAVNRLFNLYLYGYRDANNHIGKEKE